MPLMSSALLSNRVGIGQQVREFIQNSAIAFVSFSSESKLENMAQATKERANVCPYSRLQDLGGQRDPRSAIPCTHISWVTVLNEVETPRITRSVCGCLQ